MASKQGLRDKIIPVLILLLVIVITVAIFLFRDRVAEFTSYGYLGVFLISIVSSATIILPVPGMLLLFAFGTVLNPLLVGLIASAGGTAGELTGFLLGRSGSQLAISDNKMYVKSEKWVQKYGMIAVFTFAAVPPLPVDVIGIAAGALRFPVWKFLSACMAGKLILYSGMALAGAWGYDFVLDLFT